jgi:hypothetical protein
MTEEGFLGQVTEQPVFPDCIYNDDKFSKTACNKNYDSLIHKGKFCVISLLL